LPPAWGISSQTDSADPIPPLSRPSGSFPAEKPADNEPYPRNIPSPSLVGLPIYPTQYSFSGLLVILSPRSSTPVQARSRFTLAFFFFRMWHSCHWPEIMPPQPYSDPRAQILAYFAISCASATGSSVTRFPSNPDGFSVSQS
jgi:hypothetical protein